jgi:hypothetical protein
VVNRRSGKTRMVAGGCSLGQHTKLDLNFPGCSMGLDRLQDYFSLDGRHSAAFSVALELHFPLSDIENSSPSGLFFSNRKTPMI